MPHSKSWHLQSSPIAPVQTFITFYLGFHKSFQINLLTSHLSPTQLYFSHSCQRHLRKERVNFNTRHHSDRKDERENEKGGRKTSKQRNKQMKRSGKFSCVIYPSTCSLTSATALRMKSNSLTKDTKSFMLVLINHECGPQSLPIHPCCQSTSAKYLRIFYVSSVLVIWCSV